MKYKQTSLIAGLVAAALLTAVASLETASAQTKRWGKDYFPNATVVTQDGKSLRFYDDIVKDKLVVFSFIYTSCRDMCPLVTARIQQLRERMAADGTGKDVTFVSITVDPEHDRPEDLKAHADAFNAAPDWLFLTGNPSDVRAILYKLGERSRSLSEHKNEIVLGNDKNGSWARDSVFTDLNVLAATIDAMDKTRRAPTPPLAGSTGTSSDATMDLLPGQAFFTRACAACHTIGDGDRVGPDLNGLSQRRERAWLTRMITEPQKLLAEKDPTVLELTKRFKSVRMPILGLSEHDAADLIAYIDVRSFQLTPVRDGAPVHDHSQHHHAPAKPHTHQH
jgi:protein SCO1